MTSAKKILILFMEAVFILLIVFSLISFPPLLGMKPLFQGNQVPGIADITERPYPPPVVDTPDLEQTEQAYPPPSDATPSVDTPVPEETSSPDSTATSIVPEGPTGTPIIQPTKVSDEEGGIFFVDYGEKNIGKLKKVKTDKEGKKKSEAETIVDLIQGTPIINVFPSPDGKKLVVSLMTEGPSEILIDLKSGTVMNEPVFAFDYYAFLGWHADSKHLLISDSRGLWIIDIKGKEKKPLGIEKNDIQAAASSPDGRQVIYSISLQSGKSEIWMVSSEGRDAHKLMDVSGQAINFAWSPDGARVAFWDGEYYVMNADGTDLHLLSKIRGRDGRNSTIPPLWSPDGRYLLTDTCVPEIGFTDYNKSRIFLIDTYTGETKSLLPDDSTGHLFPSWSPTGKMIAFLSMKEGLVDLWVVNVDGSNLRQITTDGKFKLFQFWRK